MESLNEPRSFRVMDDCSLNGQFNSTKWDLQEAMERRLIEESEEEFENDWDTHTENFD